MNPPKGNTRKAFQPEFDAYPGLLEEVQGANECCPLSFLQVWRGFWNRPRTHITAERRRKTLEKGTFMFLHGCTKILYAPNPGSTLLITFSLLIGEDFWLSLDFRSDRSIFSTFVGACKNTAIAEKRIQKSSLISKERVNKEKRSESCWWYGIRKPNWGLVATGSVNIMSEVSEMATRVGGRRGLARGKPSYATDSDLFSAPFFLSPPPLLRRGTQYMGKRGRFVIFPVLCR